MKLLISTPHFILHYDYATGQVSVLESRSGGFYGITWSPVGDTLALAQSGVDDGTVSDIVAYATSEKGHLIIGGRATWKGMLNQPHQILWVDEKSILATNTGRNAIAKISASDFSVIQYRFDDIMWDRLSPQRNEGSHFNSIYYKNGLVYIVAHNFDKGSYLLELEWPGMVLLNRYNIPASGVHNFWIDGGNWITCASSLGRLIEARSGEILWDAHQPSYTRGLAATKDKIFIGDSQNIAQREVRTNSETGIWVINKNTYATEDYISLGHFGVVHEVRVIDEVDLCHHGTPLNPESLAQLGQARSQFRLDKLAAVSKPYLSPNQWQAIIGFISLDDKGNMTAEPDAFAMIVQKNAQMYHGAVSARFSIHDPRPGDHASLIARYSGPEDSNMLAAMLQIHESQQVYASIWVNKAGEWKMIDYKAVPDQFFEKDDRFEKSVLVTLRMKDLAFSMWAGEQRLLNIADDGLRKPGSTGIRLQGSSFSLSNFKTTPFPD